jgi:hypothetical protein
MSVRRFWGLRSAEALFDEGSKIVFSVVIRAGQVMGFFYFDESIQRRAGFVIGAWVYSEKDASPQVFSALTDAGLVPMKDEFKSGMYMKSNPQQVCVRSRLHQLIHGRSIGVVVAPVSDRSRLGTEALIALARFIRANDELDVSHEIFLDQGIPINLRDVASFGCAVSATCHVHAHQDSRVIGGIQIADLASHCLGVMLLEHMGLLRKRVRVGENSGYHPDSLIELGFEMFGNFRSSFFKAPMPIPRGEDALGNLTYVVDGYGLYVGENCDIGLRQAVQERFGTCYMGCIH